MQCKKLNYLDCLNQQIQQIQIITVVQLCIILSFIQNTYKISSLDAMQNMFRDM